MNKRTFVTREEVAESHRGLMDDIQRINSEPVPFAQLDAKYRVGKTLVFAMVLHRDNANEHATPPKPATALLLSLDGYWNHAKWFPLHKLRLHTSRVEPRFKVVQMPGALANEKELPTQAARPRLTPLIAWSDESQAEWRHITSYRINVNDAIQHARRGYRKQPTRMPFGWSA